MDLHLPDIKRICNLKKVELKRIVEVLWKSPAAEEKLPFAQKLQTVTDNGTISLPQNKTNNNEETNKNLKSSIPSKFSIDEDEKSTGMSLLRKLCFFLSLNVGVFYVLTLAWILPCRDQSCSPENHDWKVNFTDVWLTTNLETTKVYPSLAIFGYANGTGGNLVALESSSGQLAWVRRTEFIPRQVFCNFEIDFDANEDNIPDCLLSGHSILEAFNVSNGHTIWRQKLQSSTADVITTLHPLKFRENGTYLYAIQDGNILLINAMSGVQISASPLPCTAPVNLKLAPWLDLGNDTLWYLMCEDGEHVDVWTFAEKVFMNSEMNFTLENSDNYADFSILLSGDNSDGSMVLGSDVTTTSRSLAVSWADTVVMVTAQAPFNLKKWERALADPWADPWADPLGLPSSVTGLSFGRFMNVKESQLAVAVQQDSNATLFILDEKDGSTLAETSLGKRKLLSLKKLPGTSNNVDSIILESIPEELSSHYHSNISDPEPLTFVRSYLRIHYSDRKPVFETIVTSDSIWDASVALNSNEIANFVFISEMLDGLIVENRQMFRTENAGDKFCNL